MSLPPLYARWLADLMPEPVPDEARATCADCAMLPSEDASSPADTVHFNPAAKCCTFLPELPNFLIGRIIADDDPDSAAGRETVLERIRSRTGVSPLGLRRPMSFVLRYQHRGEVFGRDGALTCPHYLADGRCGIWKNRDSTCSTWFCKLNRGVVSALFWRGVGRLLLRIETDLAFWCASELGMDTDDVRAQFEDGSHSIGRAERQFSTHLMGGQLDGPRKLRGVLGSRTRQAQRDLWGDWAGREAEFYEACAKLVDPLTFDELKARIGLDDLCRELLEARADLDSTALPDRLTRGSVELIQIGDGRVRLDSYSAYDPQFVTDEIAGVIDRFDGRPTAEVIAAIEAEGIAITDDHLRLLVDYGALREAERDGAS